MAEAPGSSTPAGAILQRPPSDILSVLHPAKVAPMLSHSGVQDGLIMDLGGRPAGLVSGVTRWPAREGSTHTSRMSVPADDGKEKAGGRKNPAEAASGADECRYVIALPG
ncbi:hypothetical protein ColLi_03289 [Colletotrichum liriopes]|uniref:Uncharacterized protein n=1 Tax=Colletotrichum liriopes TaxID=708192 RepID=A0AA37GHG1_9PEZI|nr:hypothetical protein ColLi_03289 [Colletotrichum liriopes]